MRNFLDLAIQIVSFSVDFSFFLIDFFLIFWFIMECWAEQSPFSLKIIYRKAGQLYEDYLK